jgi:hypothetical protein
MGGYGPAWALRTIDFVWQRGLLTWRAYPAGIWRHFIFSFQQGETDDQQPLRETERSGPVRL